MADQIITNPNNAYRTVSDYTTMKDDAGEALTFLGGNVELAQANGAIAAGLAVRTVAPTGATVPPRVGKATASTNTNCGITASASSTAGDVVEVVTKGVAFATSGAAFSADALLVPDANGKLVALSTPTAISGGEAPTEAEFLALRTFVLDQRRVVAVALQAATDADQTVAVRVIS